jgi:transposase
MGRKVGASTVWAILKLSDAVYRQLVRDAHTNIKTGPGGHQGTTPLSSAAGSIPTTGSSDKSLPGPADTDPTNQDPLDTERRR